MSTIMQKLSKAVMPTIIGCWLAYSGYITGTVFGRQDLREALEFTQMGKVQSSSHKTRDGEEYRTKCEYVSKRMECTLTASGDFSEYKHELVTTLINFIRKNKKSSLHPEAQSIEEITKIKDKIVDGLQAKYFTIYRNAWGYQNIIIHDEPESSTSVTMHYGSDKYLEIKAITFTSEINGKIKEFTVKEEYGRICDKKYNCETPGYRGMNPSSDALETRVNMDLSKIRLNNNGFPRDYNRRRR